MVEIKNANFHSFIAHAQLLAPVFYHHLSNDSNEIFINSKPLMAKESIILFEKNAQALTIEKFLERIIEKWKRELLYMSEILNLKDQIYNEYNKIVSHLENKKIAKYLEDAPIQLIDNLFSLVKLDHKQKAGDFCNNLMNGFESEALKEFDQIAIYVLCKPLITPYPLTLFKYIQKKIQKMYSMFDENMIKEANSKISQHMFEYLRPQILETKNFKSLQSLCSYLDTLSTERKQCSVFISDSSSDLTPLIEFREKCIDYLSLKMDVDCFNLENVNISYDSLEPKNKIKKTGGISFFNAISKEVSKIKVEFDDIDDFFLDLAKIPLSKLNLLVEIYFDFSDGKTQITDKGVNSLSEALINFQHVLKLFLNFEDKYLTDKAIELLARALDVMKLMKKLTLIVSKGKNKISDVGIEALGIVFQKLKFISCTNLNFSGGKNEVTDRGVASLAEALAIKNKMKKILLNFGGGYNAITNKGLEKISMAVKNNLLINKLLINLSEGKNLVNDVGIESLSYSLQHLNLLKEIHFDFNYNQITDQGIKAISEALNEKPILNYLFLDFSCGKNQITDQGIFEISNSLRQLEKIIAFKIDLCYGMNKITDVGLEYILNVAKDLKSIEELHLDFRFGNNKVTPQGEKLIKQIQQENQKLIVKINNK